MGLIRDTRTACALPSAPDSTSQATVAHADGKDTAAQVPADAHRIVVLDTQSLDATCALGLWERVVGAAILDGSRPQPSYLGTGVKKIPSIGLVGAPDPEKVRALHPDLIVAAGPAGAASYAALSAIAPTVFTDTSQGWQQEFSNAAAAMNRTNAGTAALTAYRKHAHEVGVAKTASQTQASVLRFTADTITVQGTNSFAGQVLTDVGVPRTQYQRGESYAMDPGTLDHAEGDLIYVILAGDDGKSYGEKIMKGDTWRDLGAADDHRVFAADNAIWNGNALTAAKSMVDDLDATLNGYVSP